MTMPSQFADAIIENLQPLINGGRYPIKRVIGEDVVVEADIFKWWVARSGTKPQ